MHLRTILGAQLPAIVLLRVWLSNPARAAAGIAGIVLITWSVLPLGARPVAHGLVEFIEDAGAVWRRNRNRAIAGIIGVGLFLWSIWPVATMQ